MMKNSGRSPEYGHKWFTFCVSASIIIISVLGYQGKAQTPGDNVHVILQSKVFASDGEVGDSFGEPVAISGDAAVVGVKNKDDAGDNSGAAYVFTRSDGVWTEQTKLVASDAAAGDQFGSSVAISENTVLVGAPGEDDGGNFSGAAYVFTRSGGVWTQQARLKASDASAGNGLGRSVALFGDTAVVRSSPFSGVYVFTRTNGDWTQQAKLTDPDSSEANTFGFSVAVFSDTVVVGAPKEEFATSLSGAAYVFTRSGGVWTQQAKLTASDTTSLDGFGLSVALAGDTAMVGAPNNDHAGNSSGAVYEFTRSEGVWTEQNKLVAIDAADGDFFGNRIAMSGQMAVIEALGDDDAGSDSGSAYVFTNADGAWTQLTKLIPTDTSIKFRPSVAISGDSAMVGVSFAPDTDPSPGSAYFYQIITDDDPIVVFEYDSATSLAREEVVANHPVSIKLTIEGDDTLSEAISVDIIDSGNGTAMSSEDYKAFSPKTITFPAGASDGDTQLVEIDITQDDISEEDEIIKLGLSHTAGQAVIGNQRTHEITIKDSRPVDCWTDFEETSYIFFEISRDRSCEIMRMNLDGSQVETVVTLALEECGINEFDPDTVGRNIYWRSTSPGYFQASFDGPTLTHTSDTIFPFTSTVQDSFLAEFVVNSFGDIFFHEAYNEFEPGPEPLRRIRQLDFPFLIVADQDSPGTDGPHNLVIDSPDGTLYWLDRDKNKIFHAKTNEEGPVESITFPMDISAFTIDRYRRKLYLRTGMSTFKQANLDGSGLEDLSAPLGLDHYDDGRGKMFRILPATTAEMYNLHQSNFDGTESIVIRTLTIPEVHSLQVLGVGSLPPQGFVEFNSPTSVTLNESASAHEISLKLNLPGNSQDFPVKNSVLQNDVTVEIHDTLTGSATLDDDYSYPSPVQVTFPSGSVNGAMQIVAIPILSDSVMEGFETVILTVKNACGPVLVQEQILHEINISDDDIMPPEANDDEGATGHSGDITLNLAANDTDSDGNFNGYVPHFDGVNDYVTWGNLGLQGTSELAKFIRFRTTDTDGVLFDVEFGGGNEAGLAINDGNLLLRISFQNSGLQTIQLANAELAADGQWHSAGFNYDGALLTAYLDGVSAGTPLSIPEDTVVHNSETVLGRRTLSPSFYFEGELFDFVVYSRGLTEADVTKYHLGVIPSAGLQLWGMMNESDYGSGLVDSSPNGHPGTVHGASPLQELVNLAIVEAPQHGILHNHYDGTVTYRDLRPTTNCDSDLFRYTVKNNDGILSNTATVTVNEGISVWYVNGNASGQNNGQSWTDAFNHLQDALSSATCKDEIWVAGGIYKPDLGAAVTKDDRTATFQLFDEEAVYGGFMGTETERSERDPKMNETILSGDLLGNDVEFANNEENSFHVVSGAEKAILDGVTIIGGNANGDDYPQDSGGGLFNEDTTINIANCVFKHNVAKNQGGGLSSMNATTLISNSFFHKNKAIGTFPGSGGAIFFRDVRDTTQFGQENLRVSNCVFTENVAVNVGGGIYYSKGGEGEAASVVQGCVFTNNSLLDSSIPSTSIFLEFLPEVSGIELNCFGSITLMNSIFWEEDAIGIIHLRGSCFDSFPTISTINSNEHFRSFGLSAGDGNIRQDPLFVDASDPNGADGIFGTSDDGLQLSSGSPSIDTGKNLDTPMVDILGVTRPQGDAIDMGPYEFASSASVEFVSSSSEISDESQLDHEIFLKLTLPNSGVSESEISVDVVDAGTGSATVGTDYLALDSTTVVFPAGSEDGAIQSFTIEILQDSIIETLESIHLELVNFPQTNGSLSQLTHTVSLSDGNNNDLTNFWNFADGDSCTINDNVGGSHMTLKPGCPDDGPATTTNALNISTFLFDGQNDFMEVDGVSGPNFDADQSFTITVWARDDQPSGINTWGPIVQKGHRELMWQNGRIGYGISRLGSGQNRFSFAISDGASPRVVIFSPVNLDGFHFLTLVVDRESEPPQMRAYVDGKLIGSRNISHVGSLVTGQPLRVGWNRFKFFKGAIGEVKIYDKALGVFAVDDSSAMTSEGNATAIDVVANDTDEFNDLDRASVTIVSMPENGTIDSIVDGEVTYSPNSGFTGTDRFTYSVADQAGLRSNFATVTLTVIPDNALLAHYPFETEENGMTLEEVGLLDADSRDGILEGSPLTTLDGVSGLGQAYEFDGVNDYIEVSREANLDFGEQQSFSVTVWARDDKPRGSNTWGPIVQKSDRELMWRNGTKGYGISRFASRKNGFSFGISDGNNPRAVIVSYVNSDGFHFLTLVVDRESEPPEMRAYVDGNLVGNRDITGLGSLAVEKPLRMGWNEFRFYKGIIDDVKIYSRALTGVEIATLFLN